MKKIISILLCLVVLVSLSCGLVFSASAASVGDEIQGYVFTVGTTGGGQIQNTVGSLCLTTAILYNIQDGYPSFQTTYDLASSVWLKFDTYTTTWLESYSAVLLVNGVILPNYIVSAFNNALSVVGSSLRVPTDTYGLHTMSNYYELNLDKSKHSLLLTRSEFDDIYGDDFQQVLLSDLKGFSDFSNRLQKALVVGLQMSFDATYNQIVSIRQTLYDWNHQLDSEWQGRLNKVMNEENALKSSATYWFHKGLDYLTTSESLLDNYLSGFLVFSFIFNLFYELSAVKTLVFVSLALGVFTFVVNIGEGSISSVLKSKDKSKSNSNSGGGKKSG